MMQSTALRILSLTAIIGTTAVGHSQTWWTNGATVAHVGIGAGGNDISAMNQDPSTNILGLDMGYNTPTIGPVFLADDYTVGPSNEVISRIRIRWFQINEPDPFAYGVFLKVFDEEPVDGSVPIWSDFTVDNLESSDDYINPETGHTVYRTASADGLLAIQRTRQIQQTTVRLRDGLYLTANQRYYFAWSLRSNFGAAHLFSPSLPRRGNGRQQLLVNGIPVWGDALGRSGYPDSGVDLPFELEVTPVPEPTTFLVLAGGALTVGLRRRKET